MRPLGLAVAALVLFSACTRSASDGAATASEGSTRTLEGALDALALQAAVALLLTVNGTSRSSIGTTEGRPAQPGDRFDIASITKTIVATVVLMFVGDGWLALNDTIEDVMPGVLPYGHRITVRQLLNHSSGLDDAHVAELSPRLTLEQLAPMRPVSTPGTHHSYANVNYVVLGAIVEALTGASLEEVVRVRILVPLGLNHTSYGTARTDSFEPAPWLGRAAPSGPVVGAGGIVSTADDVATFFRALFGGDLIAQNLLEAMTRTIDGPQGFRAGLGIFAVTLSCGTAWGHAGDLPEYSSMAIVSADGSRVVVVAQASAGWMDALEVADKIYCA